MVKKTTRKRRRPPPTTQPTVPAGSRAGDETGRPRPVNALAGLDKAAAAVAPGLASVGSGVANTPVDPVTGRITLSGLPGQALQIADRITHPFTPLGPPTNSGGSNAQKGSAGKDTLGGPSMAAVPTSNVARSTGTTGNRGGSDGSSGFQPTQPPNTQRSVGMGNKNFGNLIYSGSDWQKAHFPGMVGPSTNKDQGNPQIVFSTHEAGLDAAANLALTKYDGGRNTISKIISAPGGWTPGALGPSAAKHIASAMGVGPNDVINLRDPNQLGGFLRGLAMQEHGGAGAGYTDDFISGGVTRALKAAPTSMPAVKLAGSDDAATAPKGPLASAAAGVGGALKNVGNYIADTLHLPTGAPMGKTSVTGGAGTPKFDANSSFKGAEAKAQASLNNLSQRFGDVRVTAGSSKGGGHSYEKGDSEHDLGRAFDLDISGMTDAQKLGLYSAAKEAGFTSFGFGANTLHVGYRPGGGVAWSYYGGPKVGKNTSYVSIGAKGFDPNATWAGVKLTDLKNDTIANPGKAMYAALGEGEIMPAGAVPPGGAKPPGTPLASTGEPPNPINADVMPMVGPDRRTRSGYRPANPEATTVLQKALNKTGADLKVDGINGPNTQKAVRAYQESKGLKVDGITGPDTWHALGGDLNIPVAPPTGMIPPNQPPRAPNASGGPDDRVAPAATPTPPGPLPARPTPNISGGPDDRPTLAGITPRVVDPLAGAAAGPPRPDLALPSMRPPGAITRGVGGPPTLGAVPTPPAIPRAPVGPPGTPPLTFPQATPPLGVPPNQSGSALRGREPIGLPPAVPGPVAPAATAARPPIPSPAPPPGMVGPGRSAGPGGVLPGGAVPPGGAQPPDANRQAAIAALTKALTQGARPSGAPPQPGAPFQPPAAANPLAGAKTGLPATPPLPAAGASPLAPPVPSIVRPPGLPPPAPAVPPALAGRPPGGPPAGGAPAIPDALRAAILSGGPRTGAPAAATAQPPGAAPTPSLASIPRGIDMAGMTGASPAFNMRPGGSNINNPELPGSDIQRRINEITGGPRPSPSGLPQNAPIGGGTPPSLQNVTRNLGMAAPQNAGRPSLSSTPTPLQNALRGGTTGAAGQNRGLTSTSSQPTVRTSPSSTVSTGPTTQNRGTQATTGGRTPTTQNTVSVRPSVTVTQRTPTGTTRTSVVQQGGNSGLSTPTGQSGDSLRESAYNASTTSIPQTSGFPG